MIDTKRIEAIKRNAERFHFGKATEIAANMRFLLETIDALTKTRDAALALVNQLEASTVDQEGTDYRAVKSKSGVVCRSSTFSGLRSTL